jgi:hypothetical protein
LIFEKASREFLRTLREFSREKFGEGFAKRVILRLNTAI